MHTWRLDVCSRLTIFGNFCGCGKIASVIVRLRVEFILPDIKEIDPD